MNDLAAKAQTLRQLHRPGAPLVLANAWDAATAKAVEAAGFPAVATTSAGVAHALGYEDHQDTPPDEMFAAVKRIAAAVAVPVTADLEAGYGLPAAELVQRMLDAGAVGLNFEDSDYAAAAPEPLVDADTQARRIAELREAAGAAGVDIVINARTDAYVRHLDTPVEESLRRGRLYLDAGADCVFPILAKEEGDIERLTSELDAVNVLFVPGVPEIPRLAELGVARVSVGGGLSIAMMRSHEKRLASLREGRGYW